MMLSAREAPAKARLMEGRLAGSSDEAGIGGAASVAYDGRGRGVESG
jgi:hypothetical protein